MNGTTNPDEDNLRSEAPNLFSREKKNPYEAPAGYFDSLSSQIQDKIAAQKKQPVWEVLLQRFIAPRIAVPVLASVCLVAVGIKFFYTPAVIIPETEIAVTYDDLYNSNYLSQIDEHVFEDALSSTSSQSGNANQEIENYLIENNIDVNDLVKELN